MTGIILAYVTCADADQAEEIGDRLVRERLAACVNILPGMRSIYWWRGEVETAREAVLIVKTRGELLERVTARVKELHTYTVPCVVGVAIEGGNAEYLKWLEGEATGG